MRIIASFALLALLYSSAYARQPPDTDFPQVIGQSEQTKEVFQEEGGFVCDHFYQIEEIFKAGKESGALLDEAFTKYASLENEKGT